MSGGKTIANIFAGILILFGVLFILGSGAPTGQASWVGIGIITILVGFGIILLISRLKSKNINLSGNITKLEINLPADVDIERFECQNCGSQLSMDNVKMVAGAPMVSCPYCDAAYQLTEKPKW
jgi:hypothetical protein